MKHVARPREFKRPGMHTIGRVSGGELTKSGAMLLPDRVEIEPEPGGDHYLLYRYTKAGEVCGDTWHEDLEAAFAQAEYEYGLTASDFLTVHYSNAGSARGGAA